MGNKSKSTAYGGNNTLISLHTYVYDDQGRMLESKVVNPEGDQIKRWEMKYDSVGNRIEQKEYNENDEYTGKHTSKYDEYGNETETKFYNSKDEIDLKTSRAYTYDNNGNWIIRVDARNDKPEYILERLYTYYQD